MHKSGCRSPPGRWDRAQPLSTRGERSPGAGEDTAAEEPPPPSYSVFSADTCPRGRPDSTHHTHHQALPPPTFAPAYQLPANRFAYAAPRGSRSALNSHHQLRPPFPLFRCPPGSKASEGSRLLAPRPRILPTKRTALTLTQVHFPLPGQGGAANGSRPLPPRPALALPSPAPYGSNQQQDGGAGKVGISLS